HQLVPAKRRASPRRGATQRLPLRRRSACRTTVTPVSGAGAEEMRDRATGLYGVTPTIEFVEIAQLVENSGIRPA
ncbi:MAG: hypothetical protein WCD11_37850, partial [Solirubrobacteraceae bacterium]